MLDNVRLRPETQMCGSDGENTEGDAFRKGFHCHFTLFLISESFWGNLEEVKMEHPGREKMWLLRIRSRMRVGQC